MGLTSVTLQIANPRKPAKRVSVNCLVDSGANFSLIDGKILGGLGLRPTEVQQFSLANGDLIERKLGNAFFSFGGVGRASPVIFGEKGDENLLGVVTLECLGFALDPMRRVLLPMKMILAGARG